MTNKFSIFEFSPGITSKDLTKLLCKSLNDSAKLKGITHEAIAQKTGLPRANITRALNGVHTPTLNTVIKIVVAIGLKITVEDMQPVSDPLPTPPKIGRKKAVLEGF